MEVLWIIPIFATPILSKLKMIMKKLLTTLLLFCAMTTVMAQQYTYGGKKWDYKFEFTSYDISYNKQQEKHYAQPFVLYVAKRGEAMASFSGKSVRLGFTVSNLDSGEYRHNASVTKLRALAEQQDFAFLWSIVDKDMISIYSDLSMHVISGAKNFMVFLDGKRAKNPTKIKEFYSLLKNTRFEDLKFVNGASASSTATKPNDPGEKQTGKDGFVWYKKTEGNKVGAIDEQGNVIIPIQYDDVNYIGGSGGSLDMAHYFKVNKGSYEGSYSRKGRCIISTDKGFDSVILTYAGHARKMGWCVKDGENGWGLLDAKGNVVIPYVDKSNYLLDHWGLCDVGVDDGCGAYINRKVTTWDSEDFEGVYDLNGDCVIEPIYSSVYVYESKIKTKDLSGNENILYITVGQHTRFDYNPYDDLLY